MGAVLAVILVNWVEYLGGPLKWVRFWVQYGWIKWGNYVAHSNGWDFGCNMGELSGVIIWSTKMGAILCAILVNQVG